MQMHIEYYRKNDNYSFIESHSSCSHLLNFLVKGSEFPNFQGLRKREKVKQTLISDWAWLFPWAVYFATEIHQ